MFKDYDKYLSTSLKVYTFLLVITFIMKIVGLDYFGLTTDNQVIIKIDILLHKFYMANLYDFIVLYLYTYFLISLIFKSNSKQIKIYSLILTILGVCLKIFENKIHDVTINMFIDIAFMFLSVNIINLKYKNKILKRIIITFLVSIFYQAITLFIRNINYQEQNSFVLNALLSFDYILLLLITNRLYFMEGEKKICGITVGSFSQTKANLLKLPKRLRRNLHNFKELDKETKLTYIIYFILSLIWNILTIVIILLVARLNDTFIECLFILTSFWLSKRTFGKPFHLPSMKQCFIVSNLTYYILNRITTPLGISILIPIMLGVGLSYITSKLVKKTYKPLYKGMPNNLFEETILKVTDKDSLDYKICYDYFVNNKSALQVSNKYNYTYDGVKKIFKRVNDKIKGL